MSVGKSKLSVIIYTFLLVLLTFSCYAKTISFSNITWQVREGFSNPGPNAWSANNVWVDTHGWLHLQISHEDGEWYCPTIYTDKRLGFGTYWFYIKGRLDQLDPHIVLALFNYPTSDVGIDETNEIDIELSRWGSKNPLSFNISYAVWPATKKLFRTQLLSYIQQKSDFVTHGFVWNNNKIVFQSSNRNDVDYKESMFSWIFSPSDYLNRIPQHPMPIYISLYLLKGVPPSHKKSTEIIIKKFCFISIDGKENNCDEHS